MMAAAAASLFLVIPAWFTLRSVIWLLAALDLAAGMYLLRWALPRQRRDRDVVLAVGVILLVCAAVLVGIGAWRAAVAEPPLPRVEPVPGVSV